MLKKTYRLPSVRLRNPEIIKSDLFDIKHAKNGLGFPRFGFVIPKKIDSRAVVRNSLKRKMSKCIEEIFDRIEGGSDFVVYPRSSSLSADRKEISSEMKKAFAKKDLLND